jgi:hypothetical protein
LAFLHQPLLELEAHGVLPRHPGALTRLSLRRWQWWSRPTVDRLLRNGVGLRRTPGPVPTLCQHRGRAQSQCNACGCSQRTRCGAL